MFNYIINRYNVYPQLTLAEKVEYNKKYTITTPYMKCPYININCDWDNYKESIKLKQIDSDTISR